MTLEHSQRETRDRSAAGGGAAPYRHAMPVPSTHSSPIPVAMVDDHDLFAEVLRMSLTQRGFDVTLVPLPATDDLTMLVQRVMEVDATLTLVDLDLGEAGDGARLIAPLTRRGRRVVVLTASRDVSRHGACIARGAWVTLTKSTHLDVTVRALNMTAMGVPLVSPAQRRELLRRYPVNSHLDETRAKLDRLSPRESHVLSALAHGHRVREIAAQSFVSEGTVRTQVKSILHKLGVTSQLAAVAMANEAGWRPRSS